MPKEVVVVTTKPDLGEAEYGVRDTETGQWLIHGVQIPVAVASLTAPQQATIAGARAIMLAAATVDAVAKGYVPK
jgi:citrate lyase beta subunit